MLLLDEYFTKGKFLLRVVEDDGFMLNNDSSVGHEQLEYMVS